MASTSSLSYCTNGYRYSQSMNRVALLGHIAGIEPSELSAIPARVNSPLAQIEDQLRAVRGAPSNDSMTAVVSQQPSPGPGAEQHSHEPHRSSIAMKSGPSSSRSRSRANRLPLVEQQKQMLPRSAILKEKLGRVCADITTAAPKSRFYPTILQSDRTAFSESQHGTCRSTSKGQSTMHYIPKHKPYIAPVPSWVTKTTGTQSLDDSVPPTSKYNAYRKAEHNSRYTSMATVTPKSYAAYEPVTPKASTSRSRSGTVGAKNVDSMPDGGQNQHSTYSTATYSRYPRGGFGMAGFEKYQSKRLSQTSTSGVSSSRTRGLEQRQATAGAKKYVREGGVYFEIVSPSIPAATPTPTVIAATSSARRCPRFHPRSTSLYIPPPQESASSFTVMSSTRITTAGATTASSRSPRSFDLVQSSATSRSPSPVRGAYNPSLNHCPPIFDRVSKKFEQSIDIRLSKAATRPPRQAVKLGEVRKPEQEDVSSWQFPALREPHPPSGLSASSMLGPSFKERVSSAGNNRNGALKTLQQNRGKRKVAAYVPGVAIAPIQSTCTQVSAIPLHEQESRELFCRMTIQKRQSLFTPDFEPGTKRCNEPSPNSQHSDLQRAGPEAGLDASQLASSIPRTETPPSFDLSLKRTDSLFVRTSTSESQDLFSPPGTCQ